MNNVSKIKDESDIKYSISEAVHEIGGFRKFIKTGDVVLLKPNFNTADPYPASTDLEFLRCVVEFVYDQGAKLVVIGESSTMTANTRKIMEKLGVYKLQEMERPPRIIAFEDHTWVKKEVLNGKYLKSVLMPALLDKVDKIILLPCLKTHFLAQFTGSLKLAVAFMKPFQRVKLHLANIQEKIAELNTLFTPDLVIMDARKCFITKGPSSGELREPGLILASASRIAIDIEGIKIIQSFKGNDLYGIEPRELPQIKNALELAQRFPCIF